MAFFSSNSACRALTNSVLTVLGMNFTVEHAILNKGSVALTPDPTQGRNQRARVHATGAVDEIDCSCRQACPGDAALMFDAERLRCLPGTLIATIFRSWRAFFGQQLRVVHFGR